MKEKIIALATKLGLVSKIKENSLTAEDWQKFTTAFKEEHNIDLLLALKEAEKVPQLEKEQTDALKALFGENAAQEDAAKPKKENAPETKVDLAAEINQLKTRLDASEQAKKTLEADEDGDGKGKKIEMKRPEKVSLMGTGHTPEYLFGIPAPLFAASKPWNQVTIKRKPRDNWDNQEIVAFKDEFNTYASSVAARIKTLQANGVLSMMSNRQELDKVLASVDYTGFDGTGWGEEYVVRRQDALISYIRSLPSVSNIFPVLYGVQNKMEMTNSFLTEFSQAYQSGRVYKGAFKLIPELAKVDNVMFKHLFEDMKQLEKEYVGYLNREGSDPMKWNFIEWLMLETLKKLRNEREERRVLGVRVEPTTGVAGHHKFAADGVIRRLQSYVDDFKLEPFSTLKTYTSSTILTFVETFVEEVNKILPSMQGYRLYMNEKHMPWYMAAYRTKYGTDMDFRGGEIDVKNYGIAGITGVPNMGNNCQMWITMPNNIELYEDQPGEMEALYYQRDLESLIVASWWKEGAGAYMTGKKFATLSALQADKRKHQFIFLTNPVTDLADGDTTADGSVNNKFKTVNNTEATAITDITNAEEGVVYRITCGGVTNASTIAKADKFSTLSAAFVPTALGDYLEVYYNSTDSKFIEVARKVTT